LAALGAPFILAAMSLLKRMLYLQAAVWAVAGLALIIAPGFVLETLSGQRPLTEYVWTRMVGTEAFGLALLMVLVGHRAEELWWWTWAFVFTSAPVAALLTLNAAFGTPRGSSTLLWWASAGVIWAFSAGLLVGLSRAGRERPSL
jgi:hypothetical protein